MRQGETLSQIARRHTIGLEQLRQWNKLEGDLIKVGQELLVEPPVGDAFVRYTVDKGDTLYSIARKFGLEPGQIARHNNISLTTTLLQGMTLKLQPAGESP